MHRIRLAYELPWATDSQQNRNRRKSLNCASQYIGVIWGSRGGKWCAFIQVDGKNKSLGNFIHEDDAARAYDAAVVQLFGRDGMTLNFPDERPPRITRRRLREELESLH
jgi:hypothetical protein